MNIALVGCLGVLTISSACLAVADEKKVGRSMLEETDQEVLDAYWFNWQAAVVGQTAVRWQSSIRWRWNINELDSYWSLGVEREEDLETRILQYQQRLDELWSQRDGLGEENILLAWGFMNREIELLDPDKNRVFEPIVEFRNGRELITITDIEIKGNQITMVFPNSDGKIVAREQKNGHVVGSWSVADELGEVQSSEFIGYPWYNRGCGTNGVWLSQEMIEILNGSWKIECESFGSARCEFEVLSYDTSQYKEEWYEGMRFGTPQDYSYVIVNIKMEQGEINNIIGSVRPFKNRFMMFLNYFDGEHQVHMAAELKNDDSLVGSMSSNKFGEDAWIAHRVVSKTKSDKTSP